MGDSAPDGPVSLRGGACLSGGWTPAMHPGCPYLGRRHPCPHLPGAAVSALVRGGRPGTPPNPEPRAPRPPGYKELGLLWSQVKAPSGQSTVESVASATGKGLSLSRRPPAGSRDSATLRSTRRSRPGAPGEAPPGEPVRPDALRAGRACPGACILSCRCTGVPAHNSGGP